MRKLLFIFLFTLGSMPLGAQLVQVSGYVYEKGTNQPIPYAGIYNLRNRTGTSTDINGFYTILLSPSDSVRLTAVGYVERRFTIPSDFAGNSLSYDVHMDKKIVILDSVTIGRYNMERFKEEFVNMPLVEEKKIITASSDMLNNAKPVNANFGVHLNGPFSWLYNKFSKRSKELEKLQDLKEGSGELSGSSRVSRDLVKDVTGLKEEEIDGFMQYCQLPLEDLGHINNYDLRLMIRKCYDQYVLEHPKVQEIQVDSVR